MLGDKLKHFFELLIKRPVSEALNFSNFDFIQSQALSTMDGMIGVKALFANQAGRLLAIFIDTKVKNLFAFMAFDEAFWSHSPFGSEDLFENFLSFWNKWSRFSIILLGKFFNFGQWKSGVWTLLQHETFINFLFNVTWAL